MALFPLGILSAAGAGGEAGSDFELIQTSIVSGTTTSSVTFSNLGDYSSLYKHLQIRLTVRTDRPINQDDSIRMRYNGDTGTNYSFHALRGASGSVASFAGTSVDYGYLNDYTAASGTPTGNFTAFVIDILDPYSTSKFKTARTLTGSSNIAHIALVSNLWRSTSAVSSIQLYSGSNFIAGTRMSLYGVKG
jgi:hypothetical protein